MMTKLFLEKRNQRIKEFIYLIEYLVRLSEEENLNLVEQYKL